MMNCWVTFLQISVSESNYISIIKANYNINEEKILTIHHHQYQKSHPYLNHYHQNARFQMVELHLLD